MALPLLTGASGLLVGVEVVDPPSWGTIGCQPAAFSTTEVFADRRGRYVVDVDPWELCDESSANATATLTATVQGRVVLVGMLRSWNPWVAWDASQCTPVRVAVRAHALGAEALIFAAAYLNQVPYAIVAAHESVGMPICMTWWSERNRINGQLSQQGQVLLQLHNTFRLYAPDDNPWPRHTVTSLQVYNPPPLLLLLVVLWLYSLLLWPCRSTTRRNCGGPSPRVRQPTTRPSCRPSWPRWRHTCRHHLLLTASY